MSTITTTAAWYRGSFRPYTGGVGYDGAPCVGRFAFRTDSLGAASLSFVTRRFQPDYNDKHNQPETARNFRWTVTEEATGWEWACGEGGWPAVPDGSVNLSGSHAVSLLPDRTYYLWIFPKNTAYCLWWIDGVTVTTQGSWGVPSEVDAPDGVFGRALPITLSRHLQDAVHTVTVDCLGIHSLLLERSAQYPALTWEPALGDYLPLLPDAASAPATLTVETFSGERSLGTVTKTLQMSVPADLHPALSAGWYGLTPCNEGAAAGLTGLIAGVSRAEVSFDSAKIDMAPLLGASIAGFGLSWAGEELTAPPYRSGVITGPGELQLFLIDSRGLRHGESVPLDPLPYGPPALSRVRVFRCRPDGTEDESGSAVGVFAGAEYSPLAGENAVTLTAALRHPGEDFGAETALTPETLCLLGGQDPDRSLDVRLSLTDRLGRSALALRRLPTRRWAMKFRPDGRGVAFGKAPEGAERLELPAGWQIRMGEESLWLHLHPVGSLVLADAAPAEGAWTDEGAVASTRLWRRTG